jgi:glyoxylase-like metal-dependent hydrolase (beta-lactamase superfamily II)
MTVTVAAYGNVTRFDMARDLPGGFRYWTTCYWVDGMLIDTGCAHCAPDLLRALAGQSLERIVNTHTHEDHIGANGVLQRQNPALEIRGHPLALPVLADPRHAQPLHLYRQVFWGWPEPCQAQAVAEGDIIATERYQFEVIYTPGHSQDHLCLYEPQQGWLFSGDLFVGGKDRAIRQGSDIWTMIASLKRIAALPLEWLFPGSARVRQNPAKELADKIAYYESLGEQMLDLHRRSYSETQIVRCLCGGTMNVEWVTLGHFSRRWLVRSYIDRSDD